MNKTQKILRLIKGDFLLLVLILLFIIGLYVFFSPKVSGQLFPFKRQAILNEFISATKQKGLIDPQKYWEFREFYSSGYFAFSRSGIKESLASQTKEKTGIKYNEENIDLTFSSFSSPLVDSLDMLTTQTDLNKIIDQKQLLKDNIIFTNKNSLIYQDNPKTIKIIFLLSANEMEKANGFFYYTDQDKEIVGNKNWLNITIIRKE